MKLDMTQAKDSFRYSLLLSRIFPYIKPYLFRIFIGFVISVPLGLLDGVTAFAIKPYLDFVIGGKNFEYTYAGYTISISSIDMALIIPFAVIFFAVVQGVLKYLNDYITTWTSQRITNDVKIDLFHRLVCMHPKFYDENSSGIIISRYMGDPALASTGIVSQIKELVTSVCGALGLIAVMLYSSWRLTVIGVFALCVAFLPVVLLRKRIRDTSNKSMVIGGNLTTNINETYNGNKVMAAYGLQSIQEQYFINQTWDAFRVSMSLTKRTAWMSPIMYLIASFGIAIVLGYGTYLINSGHMTAGSFASFITSLLLLYKPIKSMGGALATLQAVFVAMGRVFELFDLKPEIVNKENAVELTEFKNNISFENVNFEYVSEHPILKNLNLTVNKNETVAIVGNSGGGKSTLVNLIPRFYDVNSGAVKIDGVDIRDFTLESLRRNIAVVFQDNFLFTGSIRTNILLGNVNANDEELQTVIEYAHLQDFIKDLPEGIDTELGERGLSLSGGQRQRIAIARAMIRNTPIVILDEATSALDNESEAIVQRAMDNLMKNKTVFIIAHRLSTIKNADRIVVVNDGEIVETGTHEELIHIPNGHYKVLYDMQFKNQEEMSNV
ncbi:ABC transporter ATP-binding protein [bacterium]|nr:ABC transporter ATP-binding protein [bacterium]